MPMSDSLGLVTVGIDATLKDIGERCGRGKFFPEVSVDSVPSASHHGTDEAACGPTLTSECHGTLVCDQDRIAGCAEVGLAFGAGAHSARSRSVHREW